MFHDIFQVLKDHPSALQWLQDKGVNEPDDERVYVAFLNAVEQGLRNVAKSGSRLFQKHALASRANCKHEWVREDPERILTPAAAVRKRS